jgi:hypothetical protein
MRLDALSLNVSRLQQLRKIAGTFVADNLEIGGFESTWRETKRGT